MKTLLRCAFTLLVFAGQIHGIDLKTIYYNEGTDANAHGFSSGRDAHQVTLQFYVPSGSAPGSYRFHTVQYNATLATVVLSGSGTATASNHGSPSSGVLWIWTGYDVEAYYSGGTVHIFCTKPDGTDTEVVTVTGSTEPVHYSVSIASRQPNSSRTIEDGPLPVSATGTYVPKHATLKVKVLNQDSASHVIRFLVNGIVVSTQTVGGRAVGGVASVQTLTFAGDENSMSNGSGWGVTVDGIAASAVEGGQVAYGDPPADYVPLFPPQITIQAPTPAGSQTTTPTPGAANNTTTPPPTIAPPTSVPSPEPNTTIANGGGSPTTQDIYEAVKAALNDALDMQSVASGPPTDTLNDGQATLDQRGKLDDIQGQIDGLASSADTHKASRISKLDFSTNLAGIPRGNLGSVSTIDFGTVTLVGGSSYHVQVDLTPYLTTLGLIRSALLWLMRLCFVYKCISAVVEGL